MRTVVLHNNVERFAPFLCRAADPAPLLAAMQQKGDRAALWCGDEKLVLTSLPLTHQALLPRYGYGATQAASPQQPSDSLARDVCSDTALRAAICDYAGAERAIRLIPYAATPEVHTLAAQLRRDGLEVVLPETPAPEALWIRDYLDSKAGFRHLAAVCGSALHEGYICTGVEQAAAVAESFALRGLFCVVKADFGESGMAHLQVGPGMRRRDLAQAIGAEPLLARGAMVVEQRIESPSQRSPSIELLVPPRGAGEPQILYICDQLFFNWLGSCSGVLIEAALVDEPWYAALAAFALRVARYVQARGYCGVFDIDAVLDAEGVAVPVEANARRTGGTHVHEFGLHTFGQEYGRTATLLSCHALPTGAVRELGALLAAVEPLHYPIAGQRRGVVISHSQRLSQGQAGVIVVGTSREDMLRLLGDLGRRLGIKTSFVECADEPTRTLPM